MAYMQAIGQCFGCGRVFAFNPDLVPSIRASQTGTREPVCETCINTANKRRRESGLPEIVPLPGAYDPEEV